MSIMFAYTVTCTFEDTEVAEKWLEWLREDHLADVCNAGALDAEVVRIDSDVTQIEVRYRFESRDAFQAYERDHAPRLREEGLEKFPLKLGLRYERMTGEIVTTYGRT